MVSFIVIAKEKKKRETYEKAYASKQNIDLFDITVIQRDETSKTQSIGIEIVKQIHNKVFLKPLKSNYKLVIIEDAHFLTPEAQNALLKVLEEPPVNTYIMLGTESQEQLLPTILSRCQVILLEEEKKKMSEKTIVELNDFIQSLPELSIGEKLKHAERLAKDKEKAITWLENLILILREETLKFVILGNRHQPVTPESKNNVIPDHDQRSKKIDSRFHGNDNYIEAIKNFQKLHTLLKTTNVNPRFAIENILLNL